VSTNKKLNLKMRDGEIIYYRRVTSDVIKAIHRVRKSKDGEEVVQSYSRSKQEYIYFKEDHVIGFSLDREGKSLPDFDSDYTRIKNYLLYFWGPILGKDAVHLYIILLSYCYGKERDYCWTSMQTIQEIMGVSRPTLIGYFNKLEEFGFIFRFWTLNPEDENREETPLIKVRKQTPYLPLDLYEKLSDNLKVKHDEFIEKYKKNYNIELIPYQKPDFSEIYEEFIFINGKTNNSEIQKQVDLKKQYDILKTSIPTESLILWEKVLDYLKNKVSKPVFDVYFSRTLARFEENDNLIYVNNLLALDRLEHYIPLIKVAVKEIEDIDIDNINIVLYE
jgi:hypothetical protein